ncbi:hypothetical protein MCEREM21A_01392 [Sphingomonadaceae bacterium]|jgi:hypothetical protein
MEIADLIPELAQWNHGTGISADEWIFIEGRADHSLAFSSIVWPDFVEFDGYVLREPLNVERLREWHQSGDLNRQQIETAMNAYLLDGIFPNDKTDATLKNAQSERLATVMADMLSAKLVRDFPERRFSVFVLNGDDFGVSFHQC